MRFPPERYLWNTMLLASPFVARLVVVAWFGDAVANQVTLVFTIWFLCAISLAMSGRVASRMIDARRAAVLPLRLWANRQWRWTMSVMPEPVIVGDHAIWVSELVTLPQREHVGRVAEAIDVVRGIAPGRIARMRRIGLTLVVAPIPAYAAFLPGANLIAIHPNALAESPAVLAGVLVHELNHARVNELGLIRTNFNERVERLALIDQYYFAYQVHRRGLDADASRIRDHVKAAFEAMGRSDPPPAATGRHLAAS